MASTDAARSSRALHGPQADPSAAHATAGHDGSPGDTGRSAPHVPLDRIGTRVFQLPTDAPESDGTFAWDSTTMVLVEAEAGGVRGLGYSYAASAAARLIADVLADAVLGEGVLDTGRHRNAMVRAVRNIGRPGLASTAISAVDVALWDLKSRLLGLSLADLLGRCRDEVPAYGSGGFTSYDDTQLAAQLGGWAADGFSMVKMKVGRDPVADPHRIEVARQAVGPDVRLFVDANGAYDRRAAVRHAHQFADFDVRWLEEPVSSDDAAGLRFVRDHAPAGMAVAAGEYCWGPDDVRHLIEGGSVDVLQLDATRCLGVSGFMAGAAAAAAWHVPVSAHCAPSLHTSLMAAVVDGLHLEWFHDHVRMEHILFDGAPEPHAGMVSPDRDRPGLGLELKEADSARWQVWRWQS